MQLPDVVALEAALDGVGAQLGRGLGMSVTAEGVETEEQLEIVRGEGCTEMQGYLLSPPVAAKQIRQLISNGLRHFTEAA